jgi:hypothetical protein
VAFSCRLAAWGKSSHTLAVLRYVLRFPAGCHEKVFVFGTCESSLIPVDHPLPQNLDKRTRTEFYVMHPTTSFCALELLFVESVLLSASSCRLRGWFSLADAERELSGNAIHARVFAEALAAFRSR